ncbi:hypothetical protein EDB80DRAFT_689771 [Ilyonectria destructans]|nr:hypothetical protein EDB80DRAFT_689771 [Ilyonectria destructans]
MFTTYDDFIRSISTTTLVVRPPLVKVQDANSSKPCLCKAVQTAKLYPESIETSESDALDLGEKRRFLILPIAGELMSIYWASSYLVTHEREGWSNSTFSVKARVTSPLLSIPMIILHAVDYYNACALHKLMLQPSPKGLGRHLARVDSKSDTPENGHIRSLDTFLLLAYIVTWCGFFALAYFAFSQLRPGVSLACRQRLARPLAQGYRPL